MRLIHKSKTIEHGESTEYSTSGTSAESSVNEPQNFDDIASNLELYELVVEQFPGGICAFDKNSNMTICNRQLKEILDYPEELFANGLPNIEQLFRFKANRGEYGPGEVEQHVQSRLRLVEQGQAHRYERQLPDGKIIEVRGRPLPGGGFVTTYVDVTEQRNHSNKIEALVENFPGGIVVFDQSFNMILCNENLKTRLKNPSSLFSNGMPNLEKYTWHNAKNEEYGEGNIAHLVATRLQKICQGEPIRYERMTSDHRIIEVFARPLKNGGVFETHIDITKERLRSKQLETVLHSFPGGIGLYDTDLQLTICNNQFKDLMELPPELFENGTPSLEEILYHKARSGEFGAGNIHQLVADRMELAKEGQPHEFEHVRIDGVTLEIKGIPIDGSGFLVTCMDVTEKILQQAQVLRMAHFSESTGLPNRALFTDRLNIALAQAERGAKMAVQYFEIDNFQEINLSAGQKTGDTILNILGDRFQKMKRDTDTFAHLGGNEFAVVQTGIDDAAGAEVLARRILRNIREPIELNGRIFELDAYIGIVFAPEDGTFSEEVQTKGSTALFHAKEIGPGMIMFFHSCSYKIHL